MEKEFLQNLKVGSQVGVEIHNDKRLDIVKRITKTMIILEKSGKFNRETGKSVGGNGWYHNYLHEPTEEFLKDYYTVQYKNLIRHYIDNGALNGLEVKELKTIYEMVKAGREKRK